MGKDVIVACDFSSAEATFAFLDKFAGCERKPFLKIGMELYYAEGPGIVKEIKARGHKIFLDLKLHDIPNTVKKAMSVLSNLDVDITNLHAAGTKNMMKAALEGLTRLDGTRPLLIAVTQLTSTDQESMENDLMIHAPIDEVVMLLKRFPRATAQLLRSHKARVQEYTESQDSCYIHISFLTIIFPCTMSSALFPEFIWVSMHMATQT